jgi:hypothetical protein
MNLNQKKGEGRKKRARGQKSKGGRGRSLVLRFFSRLALLLLAVLLAATPFLELDFSE